MTKVSVIIPVYKVEPYIRQCLDSILAQTLRDIEVIVVDDGSPDDCGVICDEYAAKDERVRVIHKENGGLVSAWKAGVRLASGQYVGFVDGDDWVDAQFFEDMYRGIAATGADVVAGAVHKHSVPPVIRERTEMRTFCGKEEIRALLREFFLAFLDENSANWLIVYARWDKLYRRDILLRNMELFNEHIALDEDRIANAAILSDCEKIVLLGPSAKYHYRILAGSMSDEYNEVQFNTLGELSASLLSIAGARGLELEPVEIYIGGACYRRVYVTAAQRDLTWAERVWRVKALLSAAPDGTLDKYARARGGLFVRIFCTLLQKGAVLPCVGIAAAHSAMQKRSKTP